MNTIHLCPGTGVHFHFCYAAEIKGLTSCDREMLLKDKRHSFIWYKVFGSKGKPNPPVQVVFDTRCLPDLYSGQERKISLGEELEVVLHPIAPAVSAALVLDIGNTRSFGLVLDDLGRPQSMRRSALEMLHYSGTKGLTGKGEVFPSHVSLESIEDRCGGDPFGERRYGKPLSVLRTGVQAAEVRNAVKYDHQLGRVSQVSPKRLFWDDDPVNFKWLSWCSANGGSLGKPSGVLYDVWLQDRHVAPESMPPSTLIGAMAVELYEQAERQLNGNIDQEASQGPRRIRQVAITFPPAWSMVEREAYQRIIQKHLYLYCEERGLARPGVRISCDEATGTLLAYVANEVEKFSGNIVDWLSSIGSLDQDGAPVARFAVLDIGGGTSDLIIAELNVDQDPTGMCHLRVNRFHQDGVLFAGDELLRRVVTRIVLPAVASALCPDNPDVRKQFFAPVFSAAQPGEMHKQLRAKWAQTCWFPMAVQVMNCWQADKVVSFTPDIRAAVRNFCGDCLCLIESLKLEQTVFSGLGTKDEPDNKKIEQMFAELPVNAAALKAICREVFEDAALRFGVPIALANCDRVLLSGKTSEFKYVKEVLRSYIPLPEYKFVAFDDYHLANSWASVAGKNGGNKLADVKMTTVMGAALDLCNERGHQAFGLVSNITVTDAHLFSEKQQYWGIVPSSAPMPLFSNKVALFTPGDGEQEACIQFSGKSLLIARRRTGNELMVAQVAYELRIDPKLDAVGKGLVKLLRRVRPDGAVELALKDVADGGVLISHDGAQKELKLHHFDLRHMVAQNADFWMIDGNLQEEINW